MNRQTVHFHNTIQTLEVRTFLPVTVDTTSSITQIMLFRALCVNGIIIRTAVMLILALKKGADSITIKLLLNFISQATVKLY